MNKFEMPEYRHPDFSQEMFVNAPSVKYEAAEKDGVAPENFHSTSMYPEYFKIESGSSQKKVVWTPVSCIARMDIWQL